MDGESLVQILTEEAAASSSGIPTGTVTLFKLLMSGTDSSGSRSVYMYYDGERRNMYDLQDDPEWKEQFVEDLIRSISNSIKREYPAVYSELGKEEVIETVWQRWKEGIKSEFNNDEKREEAFCQIVSVFLHGDEDKKTKYVDAALHPENSADNFF